MDGSVRLTHKSQNKNPKDLSCIVCSSLHIIHKPPSPTTKSLNPTVEDEMWTVSCALHIKIKIPMKGLWHVESTVPYTSNKYKYARPKNMESKLEQWIPYVRLLRLSNTLSLRREYGDALFSGVCSTKKHPHTTPLQLQEKKLKTKTQARTHVLLLYLARQIQN